MERLLVAGFGDVARRAAPLLASRFEIIRGSRSGGFDLDRPETLALDRVDAERRLALWCSRRAVPLVVLRVPGIYAADRLPLERLRAGTPALRAEDDTYTNHIHAADLAAIAVRALERNAPDGIYNASDDSEMRMADWFDLVADRHGLPRPPRLPREQVKARVSPEMYSFMSESRRLDNGRLKRELGVTLRYPTVHEGLRHEPAGADQPA
jgi:nucleoside-diphosphate-sugar epimerase